VAGTHRFTAYTYAHEKEKLAEHVAASHHLEKNLLKLQKHLSEWHMQRPGLRGVSSWEGVSPELLTQMQHDAAKLPYLPAARLSSSISEFQSLLVRYATVLEEARELRFAPVPSASPGIPPQRQLSRFLRSMKSAHSSKW
jgi:hypothetical protein